jgi:hypothetical protein
VPDGAPGATIIHSLFPITISAFVPTSIRIESLSD